MKYKENKPYANNRGGKNKTVIFITRFDNQFKEVVI